MRPCRLPDHPRNPAGVPTPPSSHSPRSNTRLRQRRRGQRQLVGPRVADLDPRRPAGDSERQVAVRLRVTGRRRPGADDLRSARRAIRDRSPALGRERQPRNECDRYEDPQPARESLLYEFDEGAEGAFRMHERHRRAAGARPGRLVDDAAAAGLHRLRARRRSRSRGTRRDAGPRPASRATSRPASRDVSA